MKTLALAPLPTALLLAIVGCASFTPTPTDLAGELLTTHPPTRNFRRITEDIHVDQAVLDAIRTRASSIGVKILGVARVPLGIHPYAVLAWCQTGDSIQILETALYWGRVDGKWNTASTAEELAGLAAAAQDEFRCSTGPLGETMYGMGLVTWDGDRQINCEDDLFSDEGAVFWMRLQEIFDREDETYNLFGDAPPS